MKILFYVLQWTWGIIPNLIGAIVCLIFKLLGNEVTTYRNAVQINLKYDIGGSFSLGMFLFIGKGASSTIPHEYGHSIQVLAWGSFYLLFIALPSVIRFWYRDIIYRTNKEKYWNLPPYDSIWFERQATELGEKAKSNYWIWL